MTDKHCISAKDEDIPVSFRKLSSGWTARINWTVNGKHHQKYKAGFKTTADAQLWASKAKIEANQGLLSTKDVIFTDYFSQWFTAYKEPKLVNQTINRYKIIQWLLIRYFGKRQPKSIKRYDYQQFINKFGATHAKDTVNKTNTIIRGCVKSAILDDLIQKDFTQGVTLTFNNTKAIKVDYLNLDELQRLVNATAEKRNIHYPSRYMILTAIYTGMRLDEIQALTWKDINPIWKTISINKAWDYTRGGGFKNTKNESSKRIIRINQQLIDWLMELKSNGSEMVFMSQFKTVPTSNSVNHMLKELLNELGLQKKNFHFHSLRHSHVAYLLSQGISIYAISKRLGHSNISTTTNTYAYLLDEYRVKQDDRLESSFNRLPNCRTEIAERLPKNKKSSI